ncbi:MAG TPA: HAD family hydrolase [Gemmataceae bacterium]|nr:HAD family hydrolase [Gemmataceae bacterium]
MRFRALATDYDGTLASNGEVAVPAWEALERLRASGRKAMLVTGRELEDLKTVCPSLERFNRVVAENGALLYCPASGEEKVLAPPPPPTFIHALRDRGVAHLHSGRVIVASVKPCETTILKTIRDMGLELQVIFNKDAVMVLPSGVNKAVGLRAALAELGLSAKQVVGVGDAENDHAFLQECGCSAAVADAVPALKEQADIVLAGGAGQGVTELIDQLLTDDLESICSKRCAARRD